MIKSICDNCQSEVNVIKRIVIYLKDIDNTNILAEKTYQSFVFEFCVPCLGNVISEDLLKANRSFRTQTHNW